jgi:hypothetical protein
MRSIPSTIASSSRKLTIPMTMAIRSMQSLLIAAHHAGMTIRASDITIS